MPIDTVHDTGQCFRVTLLGGTVLWVPKDPLNADYVRLQAWVYDGGEITS